MSQVYDNISYHLLRFNDEHGAPVNGSHTLS